jgi:hypothetical protein
MTHLDSTNLTHLKTEAGDKVVPVRVSSDNRVIDVPVRLPLLHNVPAWLIASIAQQVADGLSASNAPGPNQDGAYVDELRGGSVLRGVRVLSTTVHTGIAKPSGEPVSIVSFSSPGRAVPSLSFRVDELPKLMFTLQAAHRAASALQCECEVCRGKKTT